MKKQVILSRRSFFLLLAGCLLSLVFAFKFVSQVAAKESGTSDKYQYLKTFTDVLALVEENYVEPVNTEELVEGAIKGMLLSLDPHTGYLNREVYGELQVETKGEFGGLGIEITIKDGLLTVVSPIEESPAARAGIMPGDQIIKIGDEFTKDFSLIDAVKKMRGPKGTPIIVSVQRKGHKELIPLKIIRDVIKVKSIRYRMLEDGFGYLRVAQFQEGTAREFNKGLEKLKNLTPDKELKGLVLDLRNDPGGLLTQAIRVSDMFVKDGVIVSTEGRLESQKQKYYAHDDGNEPDFPLVVLINGGSASASEIVAGALQDHKRALLLGEQSFGKGSVQTILPMERGDALRLTTALYYTPKGRSIQAQGITPDVIVEDKRIPKDNEEMLEEPDRNDQPAREKDLPGALKNPSKEGEKKGTEEKTSSEEKVPESDRYSIGSKTAMEEDLTKLLQDDPQLAEALRFLKTFEVFQGKPALQAEEKTSVKKQDV